MCSSGSCHLSRAYYTESLWHTSAALNAREPKRHCSLAVLDAQWEGRCSVVGVCCVLAVHSWHMIHQGLVPSGTDESLACYTVSLSETGTWKNITKLWLVCWCKFNFWTTNLTWRGWRLPTIAFSSLSNAELKNTWFSSFCQLDKKI